MGSWKFLSEVWGGVSLALSMMLGCAAANGDRAETEGAPPIVHSRVAVEMAAGESDPLVVQTAEGALRGVTSGSVDQFLGIPYAAPPVGSRRFAPPAAPVPWSGVRPANVLGSYCMQGTPPAAGGSEDCLSLNVYRPASGAGSAGLPVMVWIHGGSFVSGAGSGYDPRRLVEASGIIVVTINYRLGAFGFLAHPELTLESSEGLSGDYGLMDQQAALRWVQSNIAAFGGDPQRVTIQGESAGGASVCAHLASPPAVALFSGAVIQSAGCASVSLAIAEQLGARLAEQLGCGGPSDVAGCLRARTPDEILAATAAPTLGAVFGPVVGGAFLPAAPNTVVTMGAQHRVPVLIGGLRDEMRLFAAQEYPLAPERYLARLAANIPIAPANEVAALYPLEEYPEPYAALTAALSDSGVYLSGSLGGCVTEALADAFSVSTPTYAYELDDPGFIWAGAPFLPGASHTSDLAYLFDFNGFVLSQPFDAAQNELADQMVRAWGAFIGAGDPNPAGDGTWPQYDTTERRMQHFEPSASKVVDDFNERHHCAFWWQAWASFTSGGKSP